MPSGLSLYAKIPSSFQEKLNYFDNNENLKIIYGEGVFYEDQTYWLSIQNHTKKLFSQSVERIQNTLYTTIPMLSLSTALIKKDYFDLIGGFDPDIRSNDWILNIKLFQNFHAKDEFWYCEIPCFAYRIHATNISKDQQKMITLLSQVVDKYLPWEYKNIWYANIYFYTSLNYLLIKDLSQSYISIKKSWKYKRNIWRIIVRFISIPWSLLASLLSNKQKSYLKKLYQQLFQ